jgi:hypothetical protein
MTLTRITGTKNLPLLWRDGENRIDAKAREVRSRFATEGMDGVYLQKRDEAARYLNALSQGGAPDLTQYPYLSVEAGSTAPDAPALAELWLEMNQRWLVAGPFIEGIRTAAKIQVRAARSSAAIDSVVLDAVAQLDEIGPKPPPRPNKSPRIPQPAS